MKQTINQDQTILSATMLTGLYEAGQHFASMLHAESDEVRDSYTATEILKPRAKDGPNLKWPEGLMPMYTINTTEEGTYTIRGGQHLFSVIAAAEMMFNVRGKKCHIFHIQTASQQNVLATVTFSMDKIVPKLKAFCARKALHEELYQPAIDIEAGIMVATNGIGLVAHKLQDYHRTVPDLIAKRVEMAKRISYGENDIARICISFPREALAFKGAVTVEVRPTATDLGVVITASDTNGKKAVLTQKRSFPNWKSVVPSKKGLVLPVPESLTDTLKSIVNSLPYPNNESATRICMDYPRYADKMLLSHNNYDYNIHNTAEVPMYSEQGIFLCLSGSLFLKELQLGFDQMEYYGQASTFVLKSPTTRALILPMRAMDEERKDGECYYHNNDYNTTRHSRLPDNDFSEWLDSKPQIVTSKPERKPARKKLIAVPVEEPAPVSVVGNPLEAIRARVLQRLQALRSA